MIKELDLKQEAFRFYSDRPPTQVLSVALPPKPGKIALDDVLNSANEALMGDPLQTQEFARSFGKLRVGINTGSFAVRATLRPINMHDGQFIELRTNCSLSLQSVFSYPDIDNATTFALDASEGLTEMQLIKVLHMLDTAIVTGQFTGTLPVIRALESEDLLKLRMDNPGLLLRSYGNVRSIEGAPELLGIVLPTELLEKSGVGSSSFAASTQEPKRIHVVPTSNETPASPKSALIGITTAKTPHAGHLALLLRAFSNSDGKVIVELNDSGPRVTAVIAVLAEQMSLDPKEIERLILSGEIDREMIENAYKSRNGGNRQIQLDPDFTLTASNEYYRTLLASIEPLNAEIECVSDSMMPKETISIPIFDGSVSVIPGGEYSVVTRMGGQLTAKGLFLGMLQERQGTVLVDSPPLFTRAELSVLKESGVDILTSDGACIMFDFKVASGTAGDSPSIEKCIQILQKVGLKSNRLIEVFKAVSEKSVLVKTPEGSFAVNFKDSETFLLRLEEEARQLVDSGAEVDILEKLALKRASRLLTQKVIENIGIIDGQKLGLETIRSMVDRVPAILDLLSEELRSIITSSAVTMTKSKKSPTDVKLLGGLLSNNTNAVLDILRAQLEYDLVNGTTIYETLLSGSELEARLTYMGYQATDIDVIAVLIGDKTKTTLGSFML